MRTNGVHHRKSAGTGAVVPKVAQVTGSAYSGKKSVHQYIYVTTTACCVVIPFILDDRLVDAPAGVTQEEGHTGFLHLPSAVLVLIFIARRIRSIFSLVDREVDFFCVPAK